MNTSKLKMITGIKKIILDALECYMQMEGAVAEEKMRICASAAGCSRFAQAAWSGK